MTSDILINFRHQLHQNPEIAGEEFETSAKILDFFSGLEPDGKIENLGGTGLAFIFKGKNPGLRIMLRAELDALPIQELGSHSYKSSTYGKSHLCGHDGHMTILCGVAQKLALQRPEKGEVVLLFQPAEETGEGARRILEDPRFQQIKPDFAFALHNLPGFPMHQVVTRKGTFAAGSTGLRIFLTGKTSHAAHPEAGINPAECIAKLIQTLPGLAKSISEFTIVTIIHAELGSLAFGTSAGNGSLSLTLRAFSQPNLESLIEVTQKKAYLISEKYGLECKFSLVEQFSVSKNDLKAAALAEEVIQELGMNIFENHEPFRWSEDFGVFSQSCQAYLFGLGSGEDSPQLHEPTYDFPDELIETGIRIFEGIVRKVNG